MGGEAPKEAREARSWMLLLISTIAVGRMAKVGSGRRGRRRAVGVGSFMFVLERGKKGGLMSLPNVLK